MSNTIAHLHDDDLVLHYYGELEAADESRAADHLHGCGSCQERYTRLQRVLAAVESVPAPALPESFERTVWARLEPALPRRRKWFTGLFLAPPNLAWAATVVLLVAAAFFAGRLSHDRDDASTLTAEQLREGILLSDLNEHLHRSQAMLVELVSSEEPADGSTIDLTPERDQAEELVAANRLYRQTASQTGDAAVAQLLDELERLLVELAASPDHLSATEYERVRQQIAAKDLLFKLRVVSEGVRERQTQQIRARAGQSS